MSSISFYASIPAIQSGIKIGDDGMRVQFDVPESDMEEAIKLTNMRRKALVLTVRDDDKTEEVECPKPQKLPKGTLSPSQRLRMKLWDIYNSKQFIEYTPFEKYYKFMMERIIENAESCAAKNADSQT